MELVSGPSGLAYCETPRAAAYNFHQQICSALQAEWFDEPGISIYV